MTPTTQQNTGHTAGPWTIHDNIGRKGTIGVVADAAPCIIATMGNAKEWPVEARANAQLISAAPDLLEACQMGLRLAEAAMKDAAPHDTYETFENPQWAAAKMEYDTFAAAIAKATAQA